MHTGDDAQDGPTDPDVPAPGARQASSREVRELGDGQGAGTGQGQGQDEIELEGQQRRAEGQGELREAVVGVAGHHHHGESSRRRRAAEPGHRPCAPQETQQPQHRRLEHRCTEGRAILRQVPRRGVARSGGVQRRQQVRRPDRGGHDDRHQRDGHQPHDHDAEAGDPGPGVHDAGAAEHRRRGNPQDQKNDPEEEGVRHRGDAEEQSEAQGRPPPLPPGTPESAESSRQATTASGGMAAAISQPYGS